MNIKPLFDRVLVQREEEDAESAGGLVIPDTAKEKPLHGKVVAAGAGKRDDKGSRHALEVKPGDRVLFSKYSGTEIQLDGQEFLILREDEVLGVLE